MTASVLSLPSAARSEDLQRPTSAASGSNEPGPLFIVGGRMPDEMYDQFLELAGGSAADIVVIPSASAERSQQIEKDGETFDASVLWKGGKNPAKLRVLHAAERVDTNREDFAKLLQEATGALVLGGNQNRLAHLYGGTPVEHELHKLRKRGGVIGGTSAGAAIMSRWMITGNESDPRIGFGFLPEEVLVDQHLTERNRAGRLDRTLHFLRTEGRTEGIPPPLFGLGIDEETALIVRKLRGKVTGKGNVWYHDGKNKPKPYGAEEEVDLGAFLSADIRVAPTGQPSSLLSVTSSLPEFTEEQEK